MVCLSDLLFTKGDLSIIFWIVSSVDTAEYLAPLVPAYSLSPSLGYSMTPTPVTFG